MHSHAQAHAGPTSELGVREGHAQQADEGFEQEQEEEEGDALAQIDVQRLASLGGMWDGDNSLPDYMDEELLQSSQLLDDSEEEDGDEGEEGEGDHLVRACVHACMPMRVLGAGVVGVWSWLCDHVNACVRV
eukprot:597634-Pelagomonas_calceolata.AAC.2